MTRWLSVFAVFAMYAQEPPLDANLIGRIRAKVADNVRRLPNYTCAETIERSSRRNIKDKFKPLDTVRLEVAYVEGQELFGWPGAAKIDEFKLSKLVGGNIGNGDFALLLQSVFLSGDASFANPVRVELDSKPAIRCDFVVPTAKSTYHIELPPNEATVGFHGTFWVEPQTLEVSRLDWIADDVPASFGIASLGETLQYSRSVIGSSAFLLPQTSTLVITYFGGGDSRNVTSFRACHQFSGESVLSFTDPTEPVNVSAKPAIEAVQLPDDFTVEVSVETPVDSTTSAVGDPFRVILKQPIKSGRKIVMPKGAVISGRITRLEKRGMYYILGILFASIDFEGGHAAIEGRDTALTRIDLAASTLHRFNERVLSSASTSTEPALLMYPVDHLKLAPGAGLLLRSRLLKSLHNDPIRP